MIRYVLGIVAKKTNDIIFIVTELFKLILNSSKKSKMTRNIASHKLIT